MPKIPDRPGIVIHVAEVFEMLLFLSLLGFALFVKWVAPPVLGLIAGTLLGVGLGLGCSFLFFYNTRSKAVLNDGVWRAVAWLCMSATCVMRRTRTMQLLQRCDLLVGVALSSIGVQLSAWAV